MVIRMSSGDESSSAGACRSPKHGVFGRFFRNIDGCLQLMEAQSAIASGSAVGDALFARVYAR